MRCRNHNLAVADPFRAIRSEFSRQVGVPAETTQGVRISRTASDEVVVSLDLPGVPSDAVEISVDDGMLTISGTRPPVDFEGGRRLFDGMQTGEFQKSFRLDESLEAETIDAVMDLGVLTLTIPKRAELQPKKISIRTVNAE